MQILTLPVEDWQQYRALRLRALKEDPLAFGSSYDDNVEFPAERWQSRLREALKGEGNWLYFAREGGRLVGVIGAYVEQATPHTATIVSVYVPVEERGKGIARALMEHVLRVLSQQPHLNVAALAVNHTQLPAIRLYQGYGFVPVRTEPGETGDGHPTEQIVMERPLPYQRVAAQPSGAEPSRKV